MKNVSWLSGSVPDHASVKWQRRLKFGQVAFLALILLSLANVLLKAATVTTAFPFSIHTASFAVDMGRFLADETGFEILISAGIVIALAIISVYSLLYLLSRRHTWPIWAAFAFLLIDTMLLGVFAIMFQDINVYIIDFIFHFLTIWSLVSMGLARQWLSEPAGSFEAARPAQAM